MEPTPHQPVSPLAAIWKAAVRAVLTVLFIVIAVPVGLTLRVLGKDPLQLKRPRDATTYWRRAKDTSPLKRLY